jgi:hypothetical protein
LVIGATVMQTDIRIALQNLILADIGLSPSSYAYRPTHCHIANIAKLPELLGRPKVACIFGQKRAYADRVDILYLLLWAAVAQADLRILAPLLRKGSDA